MILDPCAACTENNDIGNGLKMIPTLGKNTTRLKHQKKYCELAIFHRTVNSVNVASRFVNVTVNVAVAVAVIFAVV